MSSDHDALPANAVLVHVGPRKTASTAIQLSFSAVAEELRARGVVYPGDNPRHHFPVWDLMGWSPQMRHDPPPNAWNDLAAEVRAHPDERVVLSSEHLSVAKPADIKRLVADLGPDRVHVVYVVRPLDSLLPSQWQERVKSMQTVGYEEWLGQVLARRGPHADQFWNGHDVATVLSRWTAEVPPERIVAVVNRGGDRRLLHRTFETLLGLEAGELPSVEIDNSSLPWSATELLRRVNEDHAHSGRSPKAYFRLVRRGPLKDLVATRPTEADELAPGFPEAAVEPLVRLSVERRDSLLEAGVRVVGDPDDLLAPEELRGWSDAPGAISLDLAAAAVVGSLRVSGRTDARIDQLQRTLRRRNRTIARLRSRKPTSGLPSADTAALVAELRRRARQRLTQPFRRDRSPR